MCIIMLFIVFLSLSSGMSTENISVKKGMKIAFLGDSITAQGVYPSGYVTMVVAGLAANGVLVERIAAGTSGFMSDRMLQYLDHKALRYHPDIITVSCGVNDIGGWNGTKGIAPEQYRKNMREILLRSQQAGARVYVLTSTLEIQDGAHNRRIADYNRIFRELAQEFSCPVIDLNSAMWRERNHILTRYPKVKGNVLTTDGIHLNPFGNRVAAQEILKAFGLNEQQLVQAENSWQDLLWRQRVEVDMPLRDYDKHAGNAFSEGLTVPEYLRLKTVVQ